MVAVCFVCHGNICRSPTAEGVMRRLVDDAGLAASITMESAGVSAEHEGDRPDPRSRAAAQARGFALDGRARRFGAADFARFDQVIALDRDNLRRLRAIAPDESARQKLCLLREFDDEQPGPHDVPDPWYGDAEGFEVVLDLCERSCRGLLTHLRGRYGLAPPILDIEFVPTPDIVVAKMLEVANLREHDVVYDLGCGDGRLVVEAASQYGARGVGFDLDPLRIAQAQARVDAADVGDRVTIVHADLFTVDVRPASVVMLYLLPVLNVRLVPQLQRLAPGSRIISHDFAMEGFDYDEVWTLTADHYRPRPKQRDHHVFKWTTPLERTGP